MSKSDHHQEYKKLMDKVSEIHGYAGAIREAAQHMQNAEFKKLLESKLGEITKSTSDIEKSIDKWHKDAKDD